MSLLNWLGNLNIKTLLKKHRFFFLFLLINVLAHWKILLLKTQLAYGDFHPFPLNANQSLNYFWFSWIEIGFGLYRQAGNFIYIILGFLTFILRSPLLSQKVFVFIIPVISYVGFDHLLKKHLRIRSDLSRFLSSLFYTFCPVALAEFSGGSIYSTILVYSLLPFVYTNTLDLLKRATLRKVFLHGLLLGVIFTTNNQFILLYFFSLVILFLYDLINTRFKAFKRWFVLVYTGIIAALINPIALLTSLNILRNTGSGEQAKSFVDSAGQFLMEIHITYADILLTTNFRMGSIGGFDYKFEHFWTIPFYAIVLFVLFQVISQQTLKRKADRLVFISLLNYLFITFFLFFTTLEWTFPIFRAFPLLFIFRNPSKLVYLSSFFFSIMFAFSLDLLVKTKIKKICKTAVILVIITIQLAYTWPAFVGDRGLSSVRKIFTIPPEYHQVLKTVKSLRKDETHRTSWLPIGHEFTFIKLFWLDGNKLDAQIGLAEFGGDVYERTVLESVYYAVFRENQNAALNALRIAQVDYLVVFKDDYFFKTINLNPEIINNTFKGVPIVEATDFYTIYEIGTKHPLIYTPSNIYSSNVADSYHSLSKVKDDGTFAMIPLSTARDLKIEPDMLHLFAFSSSTSPLITNTPWNETWHWDMPNVYPKTPGDITADTDTYTYLVDSMESMAEISEFLTSDKSVSNSEVSSLLASYTQSLNIFNLFVSKIPPDKIDANLYSLLVRMYLYADKSYLKLSNANLINENISSQYEAFMENVVKFQSEKCQFDYCYALNTYADNSYMVEIFDVDENNAKKSVSVDGMDYQFQGYADNNWISAGNVFFATGGHNVGLNLDQESKFYEFDDENDILYLHNDDAIKFNFTFLYDFEEDVYVDIYNIPNDTDRLTDKYLVWKGFLSSVDSNKVCYVKEGDRCYRLFVANLQPNNNYDRVRVTFYNDVSTNPEAKNVIKNVVFQEQLNPVLLLWNPHEITPRARPDVTYTKINPVKYEINVENIQDDFVLVFNQSFNTNWVLQTKDKKVISTSEHFKANYYANAWQVKKAELDGKDNASLEIVFPPQRNLNLSLGVTVVSVSICLFFILRKEPKTSS